MHFISQIRYNPSIGEDDFYYRIKESVRDLTGRVHSYVLLNVGFMAPRPKPGQVRDIAICLNWLSGHRGEQDLFGDAMSRFDEVAPALYKLKDKLEDHLCRRTDSLFNATSRIALFDLTNFYFEGRKEGSRKARHGRSKEKHSDCRLLVLALCINAAGFIRYSCILAGNTADPDSLPAMVDMLAARCRVPVSPQQRVLVCLDAGIATEDSLVKIKEKGYDYLCVSRSRLRDYELEADTETVRVPDSRRQEISLTRVHHEEGGDYYLEISSPGKQLKEESMNRLFKERFEKELTKARDALTRKGGKKTDLQLRPIYHRKDDRSDAHLFMGLLAYWIVNTIRYRMKMINGKKEAEANKDRKPGEKRKHYPTPYWTEIVRRMSTQKAVTTEAVNALGEKVEVRLCSTPKKEAADIYEMLGYKKMPFWRKIKVCSTQ